MKRLMIAGFALAAAAACQLAGCAALTSPSARISEGKAIADGWAALDGAALATDVLAKSGVLHGPSAAKVSQDLKTATTALTVATQAYDAGGSGDVTGQIAAATTAIAEISSLLTQAKAGPS